MPDNDGNNTEPGPQGASAPVSTGLQWLREIVTAGIAITILAITSLMLMEVFNSARYQPPAQSPAINAGDAAAQQAEAAARKAEIDARDKSFGQQKDILLYGLALLGTVMGYFFGRVPAELHAVQAQNAAVVAQDRADAAKDAENRAKADKARIVDRTLTTLNRTLAHPTHPLAGARDVPHDAVPNLAATREDLESLRDWLVTNQA